MQKIAKIPTVTEFLRIIILDISLSFNQLSDEDAIRMRKSIIKCSVVSRCFFTFKQSDLNEVPQLRNINEFFSAIVCFKMLAN